MSPPRLRSVLFFAAMSLVLAAMGTSLAFEFRRLDRLAVRLDARVSELVREERKQQDLADRITYYRTADGAARLAREQFNLALPNETTYRVVPVSGDDLRSEHP
jgi:cell division protein FtsB